MPEDCIVQDSFNDNIMLHTLPIHRAYSSVELPSIIFSQGYEKSMLFHIPFHIEI